MIKEVIIVGAGGTGREVADAIEDINSLGRKWNLLGFLDDDSQKHGKEYNGYPVLGSISTAAYYPFCHFVLVLGNHRDLRLTKRVFERLSLDVSRFATVIHPTVSVSRYTELGAGTVVLQNCVITSNTRIGSHVLVLFGSHIGHDCIIDDYVVIAPNAVLAGGVRILEGCYIGANATILQTTRVGPWSCVGMGAAVFSDVEPNSTVVGNPARLLKHRVHE
jgi:sugar O-acyltransferase (sialic acid O-acetyltransferase NeuD family)